MEYWLLTISSFARTDDKCPPIIIVGTHLDKVVSTYIKILLKHSRCTVNIEWGIRAFQNWIEISLISSNLLCLLINEKGFKCTWAEVVRRYRPMWTFHIFEFCYATTEWNSTKLHRKQVRNVLYRVCVFRAHGKTEIAVLTSDSLTDFDSDRN